MVEHCTTCGGLQSQQQTSQWRKKAMAPGVFTGASKRLMQKGRLLGWNYPMRRSLNGSFARLDEAFGREIQEAEEILGSTKVPSLIGKELQGAEVRFGGLFQDGRFGLTQLVESLPAACRRGVIRVVA